MYSNKQVPDNAIECELPPATATILFLNVCCLVGTRTSSEVLPQALPYPQAYISPESIKSTFHFMTQFLRFCRNYQKATRTMVNAQSLGTIIIVQI